MDEEPNSKRKKPSNEAMEVDEVPDDEDDIAGGSNYTCTDFDHISDDEEGGIRLGDIYIPPPPKPALTFDTAGPRLIINNIKNNNFKSYAGVQVLGPFHKSFTSIIGPNGSGKSNVIDSMMFVFGYRASKIRSKKVSLMIHNSALHPNCSSASVEVHFSQIIDGDGDSYTVVPGSEIVVSRTVFKDSTSFYQLNGRRVQFKEVNKLLRSHGIDLEHNRFLILQGEVEQIAMMKPKGATEHECGMLEYLEDIMSTNRYNVPLKKLEDKVELLNDQRKEKLNRVRTAEAAWKLCHEPCAAAVDLVNRTNAAVKMRNFVLQKYIHESRKIVSKEEGVLDELKQALAKIDEKLSRLRDEMKQKQAVLDADAQRHNELATSKSEASKKLQACNRKLGLVAEEMSTKNLKKKNLDQLLAQHKKSLIELELIPEKNSREIEDCKKLLEKHQNSKREIDEELETVNAGVRDRTQGFRNEKDALKDQLTQINKVVAEAQKGRRFAESELTIYQSAEAKENEKLNKLNEGHTKAEREMEENRTAQSELQSTLPAQELELESLKSRSQDLRTQEAAIVTQVNSLKKELVESTQALTATRSRSRVLDFLMKEKRNGNLPGIFGRLGDLGGIDLKYDVAISTGCPALDHIVVDTVETAQTAIQYLKRNNVGQATFIALDKQQHLTRNFEPRNYPEGAPRMFDLVQVTDERVRAAFYFALRDTLVATDLEQATRIAYGRQRYRVVSMNGDVIEVAGTMSGGGRSMMRGRMGSSVQQRTDQDPADIEENKSKLAELNTKLSDLRSELAQVDRDVSLLTKTVKDGKKTLAILAGKMTSCERNLAALKDQIRNQQQKAASARVDPERTARLQENVQRATEQEEETVARKNEVEAQIKEADKQISALLAGKPTELKKASDDLGKKITKINSTVAQLGVATKTSVKDAAKCKNMIVSMEANVRETTASLENLKTQKKTLTTEAAELDSKIKEIEVLIDEGSGDFEEIKEEMKKLVQKETKRNSERITALAAVQKKEKSVEEYRAREPAFRKDLSVLSFEDPQVEDIPNLEKPGPLKTYTPEELEAADLDELRKQHEQLKSRLGGQVPNLGDIQIYKTKEDAYLKRVQDLEAITMERNRIRTLKEEIAKKRLDEFNTGFNTITTKLKEMYQMITLGGDAELELVDSLNPFSEGVVFRFLSFRYWLKNVRPPNKSWKNISNLSGGEKTLSSLALVFALHYFKPTPLYVMDEIDAALDFKNVSIVANYIKDRTKNAQFIIISLRYNMFEMCNRLVGIYKTQDCTKSVTVENVLPDEIMMLPVAPVAE